MYNLILENENILGYSQCDIEGAFPITDEQFALYNANRDKFKVINGVFTDISNTQEYKDNLFKKQKEAFYSQFIPTSLGNIRLKTKIGDFIGILPNFYTQVKILGKLPANVILFYPEPDFSIEYGENEIEDWLISNSYYNSELSEIEFQSLYTEIMDKYLELFNQK